MNYFKSHYFITREENVILKGRGKREITFVAFEFYTIYLNYLP